MNWFLIIVAIVMTVMLMIGSLYVLVYFQAEEDKNTAWAPKIAVVLGLTLACCVVLLLPMDVANRSTGSGLDMEGLYQAVYMIIAIMILGVLPYLIFYYEAENPEGRNYQCWTAVKYEALTVLISLTVVVIMWVFLGKADVPLTEYVFNSTESERSSAAAHGLLSADDGCASPDACGLPADLRAGLPRRQRHRHRHGLARLRMEPEREALTVGVEDRLPGVLERAAVQVAGDGERVAAAGRQLAVLPSSAPAPKRSRRPAVSSTKSTKVATSPPR